MPAERIHPADPGRSPDVGPPPEHDAAPDPELPPVADLALYAARRVARRSILVARRLPPHHDEGHDAGDVDP